MFDAHQKFAVTVTRTRAEIAQALNEHLSYIRDEVQVDFNPGDDRLTDEICQAYLQALVVGDELSYDDQLDNAAEAAFDKLKKH